MLSKVQNSYFSYFLIYNFYYAAWSFLSTLISVYLLDKGFGAASVGFVVSAGYLASMICQSFIGMLHDRIGIKKVNTVLFSAAILAAIGFITSQDLTGITICYSLILVAMNGANPVMDKVAAESPFPYGRIRIWGTIGYAVATQLTGILYEKVSPSSVYIAFAASVFVSLIGFGLITQTSVGHSKESPAPLKKQQNKKQGSLLKNGSFLYYLAIATIYYGMVTVAETFIPAMFVDKGLGASTASTILSIAVFCEAPLVFFAGAFMDRIPNKVLLVGVLSAFCVEYAVYALGLSFVILVPVTLIVKHPMGMVYGMTNLKIVTSVVDEDHQITALALIATCKNLSTIVCQNAAGRILDNAGYSMLFAAIFACSAVALILAVFFKVDSGNDKKLFS